MAERPARAAIIDRCYPAPCSRARPDHPEREATAREQPANGATNAARCHRVHQRRDPYRHRSGVSRAARRHPIGSVHHHPPTNNRAAREQSVCIAREQTKREGRYALRRTARYVSPRFAAHRAASRAARCTANLFERGEWRPRTDIPASPHHTWRGRADRQPAHQRPGVGPPSATLQAACFSRLNPHPAPRSPGRARKSRHPRHRTNWGLVECGVCRTHTRENSK